MVEFITGQAGSGKTTLMFGRILKDIKAEKRVCVLVPEQYSHDFDKKLYIYLGAHSFNEIISQSFTGLARQLFQLYGEPGKRSGYADDMARMIMIYQAISEVKSRPGGLTYFLRRSGQNGFAEETLSLINEMKRSGVTPDELTSKMLLFDDRLRDKTHDIAQIYDEYQRLMSEYGYRDNLQNVREAAAAANKNDYFKGMTVYIDEFESFTADQLEMIEVIVSSADNVCIALRTDDENAGEFTLFETVNSTCRRIKDICRELHKDYKSTFCKRSHRFASDDLAYLSGRIMRNLPYESKNAPEPENIHIFEAKDMYSEAEYICATIKRLIYNDSSLHYRNIAVISNDISEYSGVLSAAFERYDIPYFLSVEKSVTHAAVMVYFTSLLSILTSGKFRTESIMRFLKCGIPDITLADISLLENYCCKWSVDGDVWLSRFTADDKQLGRIEELRAEIIDPLVKLKKDLRKAKKASEICTLLYDYMESSHAELRINRLMGELIKDDRDYEAAELKRLWGCLIDILDSIYETLGEREIHFGEAARLIKSMIGQITYSLPPQTLDEVTAASARTARLNAPKVVFVLGANDGAFPNHISLYGLFSEADKQKLADSGLKISTPLAEMIAAERLVVYKSLSAASQKLYITYPLSDLSGQARYPAQIIDQIIKMFGRNDIRTAESEIAPHYYAVTMHSAFYHYMQNRRDLSPSVAAIEKMLMSDPDYKRRVSYVLSRSDFRHNYRIDKEIMEKLQSFTPLRLSSTGLEEYNLCRFKYFCDKCLRLQSTETMELDARIAGELTHECFCGVLGSRSKSSFIDMTYEQISGEVSKRANDYRSRVIADGFGKDAKFDLIFSKLTERLTEVFMHTKQSLMVSDFTPHSFELDLRGKHSIDLSFGDGYTLTFGGVVDRADLCTVGGEKYLRIVDYKSSRKDITAETLASGVNMQMLLYLFACVGRGGAYEGCQPAGVLYSPIKISDIKLEQHRVDSVNSSAVNSSLKTSGLVLGDRKVIGAMEHDMAGVYIPAKLGKDGEIDGKSSCVSRSAMELLREFTYSKLIEMAERLLCGEIEAKPLKTAKSDPCEYCDYKNICDSGSIKEFREPDEASIERAKEILSNKFEKKEDE